MRNAMRIFDQENNKTLKDLVLCLTRSEAIELRDSINIILKSKNGVRHEHIDDDGFCHELSIMVYDQNDLTNVSERLIKVIKEDL